MKKLVSLFVAVVVFWMFASWCDIVADNNKPRPEHSKYNFFCLMFQQDYEVDGVIADAGLVVDSDGNVWEVDTHEYKANDNVIITLNDRGTLMVEDDEVVRLSPLA